MADLVADLVVDLVADLLVVEEAALVISYPFLVTLMCKTTA